MTTNTTEPVQIKISDIFKNVEYIVPIYQRNYSWEIKHIQQLLDDINSAENNYYMGTLIVNQKDFNVYEVIDGQQRLTTLYLLELYLLNDLGIKDTHKNKEPLQFEARERYHSYLQNIRNGNIENDDEFLVKELNDAFNYFKDYFKTTDEKTFKEKLEHVYLVRVQVPKGIDLNHYFEIMNTRGEQLELHQIVKAKILSKLDTKEDKEIAADIWDSCANMDSYIQMNFDKRTRSCLFTDDWSDLKDGINDWENLKKCFQKQCPEDKKLTLKEILEKSEYEKESNNNKEDTDNERFESVISFPNFILQVNSVILNLQDDDDTSLDDNNFINILERNWENKENAKSFILKMLQCRTLFDKYILKREYAKEYKQTGKWSLQKLVKYIDKQRNNAEKPIYKSTYSKSDINDYEENDKNDNTRILTSLEVALRITYTAPKTMHWITIVIKKILENKNTDLIKVLEEYCQDKIKKSRYKEKSGFDIERIVFTYLDYLLYRDKYFPNIDWEFQFRNSIEHFYPQNPDNGEYWNIEDLDDFGNLALITVSGNSKFSNMLPSAKIEYDEIIKQSLKLRIMKEIVERNNKVWTAELAKQHKEEMIKILDNNGIKRV